MQNQPARLGDLLQSTAQRFPDKEALVFNDTRLTWRAFNNQVNALASAFLGWGVERGDRIGVICTTRPEYLCVYMAAARIGAMLVGFNTLFTPPELLQLAQLTTPKVMVVIDQIKDKPVAEPLKALFESLTFVQAYIVIGQREVTGGWNFTELVSTPQPDMAHALAERAAEVEPDDGALMVFTSGSTGVPKGAVLTHRSILSTGMAQAREFGYRSDDRVMQNKPMNHVGGTVNQTLPSIISGATLIFMDHFHPIRALETIQRERITILGQVPTMFIMEFNLPNFSEYDLSSVRLAIVGGAATPLPVMRKLIDMADEVMTGFGMTETGGYITFTCPDDPPEMIATSVGRIAAEFELCIVDEERKLLPTGAVGEVALRGDCLLKAYFNNPTATKEAFDANGWFYTGDMGRLDERGYLTLVDRKKDMYINGGYNVYPREIELYVAQHPDVALVAVLGIADSVLGEIGVACLTLTAGAQITAKQLRDYCVQGLAEYKIPRHFLILETLPLTPLGKIDKPRLRQEITLHGELAG